MAENKAATRELKLVPKVKYFTLALNDRANRTTGYPSSELKIISWADQNK